MQITSTSGTTTWRLSRNVTSFAESSSLEGLTDAEVLNEFRTGILIACHMPRRAPARRFTDFQLIMPRPCQAEITPDFGRSTEALGFSYELLKRSLTERKQTFLCDKYSPLMVHCERSLCLHAGLKPSLTSTSSKRVHLRDPSFEPVQDLGHENRSHAA